MEIQEDFQCHRKGGGLTFKRIGPVAGGHFTLIFRLCEFNFVLFRPRSVNWFEIIKIVECCSQYYIHIGDDDDDDGDDVNRVGRHTTHRLLTMGVPFSYRKSPILYTIPPVYNVTRTT